MQNCMVRFVPSEFGFLCISSSSVRGRRSLRSTDQGVLPVPRLVPLELQNKDTFFRCPLFHKRVKWFLFFVFKWGASWPGFPLKLSQTLSYPFLGVESTWWGISKAGAVVRGGVSIFPYQCIIPLLLRASWKWLAYFWCFCTSRLDGRSVRPGFCALPQVSFRNFTMSRAIMLRVLHWLSLQQRITYPVFGLAVLAVLHLDCPTKSALGLHSTDRAVPILPLAGTAIK